MVLQKEEGSFYRLRWRRTEVSFVEDRSGILGSSTMKALLVQDAILNQYPPGMSMWLALKVGFRNKRIQLMAHLL